MFKVNPLLATDSYKLGHASMYPEGTEYVYSNFTARSNTHLNVPVEYKTNKIVFFGLQAVLKEMIDLWNEQFFWKPFGGRAHDEFHYDIKPFIGDNEFSIKSFKKLHNRGYLPFRIKALPEGSRVNIGVPVFTIINTDPEFYWLTNYVETYLSDELWKPTTVATIADRYKAILMDFAEKTGGSKEFVQFQGHDFSMRGMSGTLDSVKCAAGHLTSFVGSDNLLSPGYINYYYPGNTGLVACSVPASEHSVMCAGEQENEKETIRRLIQDKYPSGPISVVSDSWDFWKVITEYASDLKDVILNRGVDSNGISKVIFRPDSGDPADILCGDVNWEIDRPDFSEAIEWAADLVVNQHTCTIPHGEYGTPELTEIVKINGNYYKLVIELEWNRYDKQYYYCDGHNVVTHEMVTPEPKNLGAVECLWNIFGGTINEKGYKTLNQKVGLIYGDSITLQRAVDILSRLEKKGFASDNIVFGIGSFTYQYITRDTLGFAMKATHAIINEESKSLVKNPITDNGVKKSAKGLLRVEKEGDNYVLYDNQSPEEELQGELEVVCDGYDVHTESFSTIRERLNNY